MSCNTCKHFKTDPTQYPCMGCTHNSLDRYTPMTNYEHITSMSVEELANFICDIYASNEHKEIRVNGIWMFPEDVEEWLTKIKEK